jgi:hypothetical protein
VFNVTVDGCIPSDGLFFLLCGAMCLLYECVFGYVSFKAVLVYCEVTQMISDISSGGDGLEHEEEVTI